MVRKYPPKQREPPAANPCRRLLFTILQLMNKEETLAALARVEETLTHTINDCNMALDGTWDRGDYGFEATRDNNEFALELVKKLIASLA